MEFPEAAVFRTDMPIDWQVMTIQGVIHAASGAVHRGEVAADRTPGLIRATRAGRAHASRDPGSRPVGIRRIAVRT